ncbi:MAG: asparagine synthase-related protein [Bacillota bacterium]
MGSICGVYRCDGGRINPQLSSRMMDRLGIYPLDAQDTWQGEQVFLGNYLQYLTPQSLLEKLPYADKSFNLVITADAIIDNREELFSLLDIKDKKLKDLPDSDLILRAYEKWGRKCPSYLLGDFAFAIWDTKRKEMFCAVDHTGNRTLYYYASPRLFAFATLINPLFALEEISRDYSEAWICDFLSIPSVIHQIDPELTLYRDILMLPSGHSLTVSKGSIKKQAYWVIEKQKELKLKSDREYEEAFRQVLGQAVRCRLRSNKPLGIMLSGGLDSAAIACLAADELKKANKELHAFTAIPIKGFDSTGIPRSRIADETPYIEVMRENKENILFNYHSFPGRNALSDTAHYLKVLEQPYKICENLFWIDGILEKAQKKGVGTMLTGGVGNTTISYGSFLPCSISFFLSGKWIKLIQEIRAFGKVKNKHPLKLGLDVAKSLVPYEIQLLLHRGEANWERPFALSPVNPDFAHLIGMKKRFKSFNYDPYYQKKLNAFHQRQMMLSPYHLSHLSAVYTKIALSRNLIIRDPAIDKRVIEFCLSVPVEQFIRKGQERSLIRRAMAGILPDKIRLNDQVRGLQSADYVQRLLPLEKEILQEIKKIGQLPEERKYLDVARIHKKGQSMNLVSSIAFTDPSVTMLLRSIIFSRFLGVVKGEGG